MSDKIALHFDAEDRLGRVASVDTSRVCIDVEDHSLLTVQSKIFFPGIQRFLEPGSRFCRYPFQGAFLTLA